MKLAFFDMDKTLLSKSSGTLYIKYLWRRRMISLAEMVRTLIVSAQYSLNVLDFPKAMARLGRTVKNGDAAATKTLCDQWVRDDVLQYIAPKALARLRGHQAAGDLVWLLSASTQFAVRPVAEHIGVPCRFTELEIVDGRFSGGIVDVDCYGEGKRIWGERLARQHNVSLSDCVFYTDSYSDRPLLDAVGVPVPVNPDRDLRRYADKRGWAIEYFY
jgi:HAD superfamily hydrolase (TIGR01490 family)